TRGAESVLVGAVVPRARLPRGDERRVFEAGCEGLPARDERGRGGVGGGHGARIPGWWVVGGKEPEPRRGRASSTADAASDRADPNPMERVGDDEARRWIVETIPSFVMVMDREHRLLFLNRTVAGLTMEQSIGVSAFAFIPPEYHAVARDAY